MGDTRLKILSLARRAMEEQGGPADEREYLLKLLDILSASIEKFSPEYTESTEHLVQGLFDNRALLAMLKQQTAELDALKKLSIDLTSSLDLPDVLDAVVSEALRLIANARDVHIFLYKNKKLTFGAALDAEGNRNKDWSKPRTHGLTYTVARDGEMIIVEDMKNHPLFVSAPPDWQGSIIGIPLKVGANIVGVMNLARSIVGGFSASDLRLLSLLADQAAVAISNASLHQIISRQAYSDTLTGLPNRRALDERLEEEVISARKNNYSFAVIMMDLDGFKDVNDTYGHPVGDDVLRLVFSQMARGVRNTDFLARYGGDELTLITREADQEMAERVTQKIIDLVKDYKPAFMENKTIQLGITAGIAIYPTHSKTAGDLLRAADAALYQAKKHHRGQYSVAKVATGPLDPITIPRKQVE